MAKTAIVYYSLEGTTEAIAKRLGFFIGADLIRMNPKREPPKKGPGKFLVGGLTAVLEIDPQMPNLKDTLAPYENVVVAFPIWAGTYPPAVGALVDQGGLLGKKVYLIASSKSGNTKAAFLKLNRKLASVDICDRLSIVGADETALKKFARKNGLTD
ncbi:MAG: flavodoxin family protein [Acutalibacteraceae bacterium]